MTGWLPDQVEAVEWMWKVWGGGGKDDEYVRVEKDPNRPLN
jgi:hypothetical protein